jgi:hypothetical protein
MNVMNEFERKASNDDLIRRMRAGEKLSSFNAHSSWFPPRPLIQKDSESIKRLFEPEEKGESNG